MTFRPNCTILRRISRPPPSAIYKTLLCASVRLPVSQTCLCAFVQCRVISHFYARFCALNQNLARVRAISLIVHATARPLLPPFINERCSEFFAFVHLSVLTHTVDRRTQTHALLRATTSLHSPRHAPARHCATLYTAAGQCEPPFATTRRRLQSLTTAPRRPQPLLYDLRRSMPIPAALD